MPAIDSNILTLPDIAKRDCPGGTEDAIIEILSKTNEILTDAPAKECNSGTVHITTLRDSIPEGVFRGINQGSPVVQTTRRQITENTGLLELGTMVDDVLLELTPNHQELVMSQSHGILEGLAQTGAEKLFYGDMALEPMGFTGFMPRYNNLNPAVFQSRNILDYGGTGANLASILILQWDSDACHLLYPRGTTAGVRHKVYPNQMITDASGNTFSGVVSKFSWYLGLAVRDWRRVVRIANIDVSELDTMIQNGAQDAVDQKLMRLVLQGIDLLPNNNLANTYIYTGRRPHTMLTLMASEKSNVNLTYTAPMGDAPLLRFLGIPIRRCDSMLVGEDQVVSY